LHVLELMQCHSESVEIVDLSLEPMVQVSEWVPQVLNSVLQALDQVTRLVVIHDKLVWLLIHIVSQVGLLILGERGGCALVRLDKHLLLG